MGGGGDERMVFILTDQNFSSVVHCENGLNCPKVIIIENGSIGELVKVFVERISNGKIPPGSVIACSSATDSADVGIATYARDFVDASRKIFGRIRGEVLFTHGAFVFLGGVDDPPFIRATAELVGWLKDATRQA
jgi:hypothetical protein